MAILDPGRGAVERCQTGGRFAPSQPPTRRHTGTPDPNLRYGCHLSAEEGVHVSRHTSFSGPLAFLATLLVLLLAGGLSPLVAVRTR
jgi:hypothetical protein